MGTALGISTSGYRSAWHGAAQRWEAIVRVGRALIGQRRLSCPYKLEAQASE